MNGYYINLKYREDRNDHFINNIKKYDFFKNIERFEGIHDKDFGEIGCVKSHIDVLRLCLQKDDEYYLIMEDDFCIINEENLLNFFTHFNKIKNKEWDIITLTPSGDTIYEDYIEDFLRIKNTITITGYIIRKDKIQIILNNFLESLNLLVMTGDKEKYMLDIHWFGIQDKVKFYYYKDIFASQLIGYSDLQHLNIDQNSIFINQNNYKKNLLNKYLLKFINEPYNDINNFNLGYEYEDIGQTASALSYYLRCAEFTKDTNLSYECLLRMSKCLSKQGNRDNKELTCIKHALSIYPNRPEANYILSLYYSYRKKWLDSYIYACIGLENKDKKYKPLIKEIGYFNIYQLLFQKAYTGYHKGKIIESKNIYYDLLNNYKINNYYKDLIINNLKVYPEPNHKVIEYTKDKYNKLKYKFINSEKIEKNYSQIYQDMFVLSMHNGKYNGIYLEIGSGDPIYGNNTYLLETNFDWNGISIDINKNFCNDFKSKRKNECVNINALEYDYNNILNTYGNIIDYLQLDCDPPNITYSILLKIPFDKIKFGVITYEHDYYNDKTKSYRKKSRDYLNSKGYKLIVGNISPDKNNNPFEDWWIHPDIIEESIWKQFIYKDIEYINGEEYMFYSYLNNEVFLIDENIYKLENYHNNETVSLKLYKTCNVCDCIRRGYRWEEHQHNIIDKFLSKKSICIEAGSHIGTISVKLSKVCKKVYCFEPVINTYNLLRYNMENNCDNNYELFNKGLGECCKSEYINWISQEGSGGIGLTNNLYSHNNNKIGDKIDIITIDSLELDKLDYIKIDVEGYEKNIINGGINTINKYKPIIILECYKTFEPLVPATLEFIKNKYKSLLDIGYNVKHIWKADFLFTYSPKLNLIFFGNNLFNKQKERLKNQALQTNWFNNIFIETPETIKDFIEDNKEIFKYERGYGYWLWKPYIILRKLQELNENDILVYIDCGSSVIKNEKEKNKYLKILNNKSIITFANTDHIEKKFQKKRVLKHFNLENDNNFLNSYHIESGCIIIKNNNDSKLFIKEWLELCKLNNYELLNDIKDNEDDEFIEHRHDQSILSILSKKTDIVYIMNNNELYKNTSCFYSSRLTDNGPRKYAKNINFSII